MKHPAYFGRVFFLILLTIACSKDDLRSSDQLVGVWYFENDWAEGNRTNRTEWNFSENGTIEMSETIYELDSKELLGYSSVTRGTFHLNNNRLTIQNRKMYATNYEIADFSDLETLLSGDAEKFDGEWWAKVDFENRKNKIVLTDMSCPPNALCVPSLSFTKK